MCDLCMDQNVNGKVFVFDTIVAIEYIQLFKRNTSKQVEAFLLTHWFDARIEAHLVWDRIFIKMWERNWQMIHFGFECKMYAQLSLRKASLWRIFYFETVMISFFSSELILMGISVSSSLAWLFSKKISNPSGGRKQFPS